MPAIRSVSRGRSQYRTPPSKKRKREPTRSSVRSSTAEMLISLAESLSPSPVVKGAAALARSFNRSTSSSRRGKGYSGKASFGGKIKRIKKKNSSVVRRNGKLTKYGIESKGITLAYEKRKVLNTNPNEAVAVGHTSLPGKVCLINMFRAMTKALYLKSQTTIADYSDLLIDHGFVVGDVLGVSYYLHGQDTTETVYNYTVSATSTFDAWPAILASDFDDAGGRNGMRWSAIFFVASASSRKQSCSINLTNMKIAVAGKSILKIQNVTTETEANDEADDVTNVPLHGKIYRCKGNNFVRKSNGKMLDGMFDTFNEEALYGAWAIQNPSTLAGTSVAYYDVLQANDNVFIKPAEIPKPWEIKNCSNYEKVSIKPGDIKTSVLTHNFEMNLSFYTNLLLAQPVTQNDNIVYEARLGMTNVIYLDKVIGRTPTASNNIKLWAELEYRQSAIMYGKESTYTLPITYQMNF